MKKLLGSAIAFCLLCTGTAANAHFMMAYTPETFLPTATETEFRFSFNHPADAGHVMDMGGILELYAVSERGKTDLKQYLRDITWTNGDSAGPAFAATVPASAIRSMGDHVVVLVPGFYMEEEEDIYMQQITKLILNVAGAPTIWAEPVGLPTEIVPMSKPYALWTGNTFQGQVLANGKPVANAEIEVEYMSNMPNMKTNKMAAKSSVKYPNETFVTQTIFADDHGIFTYTAPKAGWWGFAALGVGPATKHNGKELSQDAVLWIQTTDMK